MHSFIKTFFTYSSAVVALFASTAFADSKIRTRYTSGAQGNESAIYTHGERHRMETGASVLIQQPDLKRMIQVDSQTKTYRLIPTGTGNAGMARKGGTVEIETTITDTGERKEFFGYPGRHLRMEVRQHASADACNHGNTHMETDGWYIDFDPAKQPAHQATIHR